MNPHPETVADVTAVAFAAIPSNLDLSVELIKPFAEVVATAVVVALTPGSPFAPFRFVNAKSKVGAASVPPLVTATLGVPVVLLTVADAVIVGVAPVAPVSPLGPCSPLGPLGPVSPFCPFKFLKAKLNTFAVFAPDAEIVTDGVPTLASTVAVGVPKPAAAPVSPLGP